MSGGSSTEDILKSVTIGAKVEDARSDKTDTVWLLEDEWKWLVNRLGVTQWNSQPETRKAIAEFVLYLRELKEQEVEVSKKA